MAGIVPVVVHLPQGAALAEFSVVIRVQSDIYQRYADEYEEPELTPREAEARFLTRLVQPSRFDALQRDLADGVRDTMGEAFAVARVTIRPSNSFELAFVVVAAYNVIVRFNEVFEALRRAAQNLESMVYSIVRVMGAQEVAVNARWSLSSDLASLLGPSQPVAGAAGGSPIVLLSWRRVLGALAVITYLAGLVVGIAFLFSLF